MNSTAVIIEVYLAGAATGAGLMYLWNQRQQRAREKIPNDWLPKETPMMPKTRGRPLPEPRHSPFAPKPRQTNWAKDEAYWQRKATEGKAALDKPEPDPPSSLPSIDWGRK